MPQQYYVYGNTVVEMHPFHFILQFTLFPYSSTWSCALLFQYCIHPNAFYWLPCDEFQCFCLNCCLLSDGLSQRSALLRHFWSPFYWFNLNCVINMTLPCLTLYTLFTLACQLWPDLSWELWLLWFWCWLYMITLIKNLEVWSLHEFIELMKIKVMFISDTLKAHVCL